MNLMYAAQNNIITNNPKINVKIENLMKLIEDKNLRFTSKYSKLGDVFYYENALPIIGKNRDVLTKPTDVCKIYLNWNRKNFSNLNTEEIVNSLHQQYGWSLTTVDADHKRNKFKNKSDIWVLFDSEEEAEEYRKYFNKMFITALEWDTIEEYKRFKENPEKRPLTFDQQTPNAYELYEAVDNGEF
jgi:hypothetical protein